MQCLVHIPCLCWKFINFLIYIFYLHMTACVCIMLHSFNFLWNFQLGKIMCYSNRDDNINNYYDNYDVDDNYSKFSYLLK